MATDKRSLYDELRPLLDRPKPPDASGRIWSFCPVHGDGAKHGRRSLSLHPVIGLNCFAGCRFEDILEALGARKQRRSEPVPLRPKPAPTERDPWDEARAVDSGTLVAVYQYRDAQGVLRAEKGRFERPDGKKSFKWRKPGDQAWSGGVRMSEMPLWGADAVAQADPTQPVIFVEGEKAAEACRARGLLAVTLGGGAGANDFGDALEVLRGREVLLWPDNDAAGRSYMARIHAALKPIAKSVRTVVVPLALPEKGDAFDYFSLGGTWEQIEDGDLRETTVDFVSKDAITVRVPTALLPVTFSFREIEVSRRSIEAELVITTQSPGHRQQQVQQRVNLLSSSQRNDLRRDLETIFGKDFGWTAVLVEAFAKARQAVASISRAIDVFDVEQEGDERLLIDAILPWRQHTILFGDGSAGKTFLAIRMAASVALGEPFMGRRAVSGRVLYVDYETTEWVFKRRMRRVMHGLGCHDVLPDTVWYWAADGIPVADHIEALRTEIAKRNITFMVVDSAASACGGEPAAPEATLRYCNALARLPVTVLTLAHVPKDGRNDYPFGSIFWHNHARRTWYVAREQEEDSDEITIGMYCKKVNDGRMPRPLGIKVSFVGEDGPVTCSQVELRDVPGLQAKRPTKEQLVDALRAGAMSGADLSQLTGLDEETVTRTLRRHTNVFVRLDGDYAGGRGRATLWGLKAREA